MKKLKLIFALLLYFFELPAAFALDQDNQTAVTKIISTSTNVFSSALNYQLFSLDSQSVTVSNIFIAMIALIIGLKIARRLSHFVKQKIFNIVTIDKNSANLISRVIDYTFMIAIIIIVLDIARVPLTIFTFIGGAFVVSIGLSAQHLVNNFISGIALIMEGKVKIGDLIEFDNIIGRVESIDARSIQVKTQNNLDIFIPHSKIMQERFTHWTFDSNRVRIMTSFCIEQNDHFNGELTTDLINLIAENKKILPNPKPEIYLNHFENNLLFYEVFFWINIGNTERKSIISEVNNQILLALKERNVNLAIPAIKHL